MIGAGLGGSGVLPALGTVLQAAPSPSDGEEFNSVTVSPGLPGFLATFVLAVVVVLLLIDMTRRVRRVQARARVEERQAQLEAMKDALGEKVSAVRLSQRLKSHPVCLTAEGALSLEMEKVLGAMPGEHPGVKAQRVLELNANHPVFQKLKALYESDREQLGSFAGLLYAQALLIEGLPVEDPVAFSNAICELMAK